MRRVYRLTATVLVLGVLGFASAGFFLGSKTIHDLLEKSEKLQQAIASLTHEDQIGFAKVIYQEERDGQLYTTIRFVETARGDLFTPVLQKEYEIEGDVVHFDALIVTFSDEAVMDGKARSLYIWRRIYGENQSPSEGFDIATPGTHPERYADLLRELKLSEQQLFWEEIWSLASNPNALRDHGIKAVYGNAVYKRLHPGLIYIFKIGVDGQVYPEAVPDI